MADELTFKVEPRLVGYSWRVEGKQINLYGTAKSAKQALRRMRRAKKRILRLEADHVCGYACG